MEKTVGRRRLNADIRSKYSPLPGEKIGFPRGRAAFERFPRIPGKGRRCVCPSSILLSKTFLRSFSPGLVALRVRGTRESCGAKAKRELAGRETRVSNVAAFPRSGGGESADSAAFFRTIDARQNSRPSSIFFHHPSLLLLHSSPWRGGKSGTASVRDAAFT